MSIVEYLTKLLEDRKESIDAEYKLAVELFDKSESGTSERLDCMCIMEKSDLELMKIEDCFLWIRKIEIIGAEYFGG